MSVNIPALFFDKTNNPQFEARRETMKQTCNDPQVVEVECKDGLVLYIRYKDGELSVREKWNGNLIGFGNPYLDRDNAVLDFDRLEFYLEMYSQFKIRFV